MPTGLGIQIESSEPRRVDMLCPACALPSVWEWDMFMLSAGGIGPLGTFRYCPDCGHEFRP